MFSMASFVLAANFLMRLLQDYRDRREEERRRKQEDEEERKILEYVYGGEGDTG